MGINESFAMPDQVLVRCFILPLSLVIVLPLLLTPAAVLPWLLRSGKNQSETRITLELDLLATLKSLQHLLDSPSNGSSDDQDVRFAAKAAKSRPLRWGIHVRQNKAGDALVEEYRNFGADASNDSFLVRSVPGFIQNDENSSSFEGSGDEPARGVLHHSSRIGPPSRSNVSHH